MICSSKGQRVRGGGGVQRVQKGQSEFFVSSFFRVRVGDVVGQGQHLVHGSLQTNQSLRGCPKATATTTTTATTRREGGVRRREEKRGEEGVRG